MNKYFTRFMLLIFMVFSLCIPINVNAEESTNYFELSIVGSTGWTTIKTDIKSKPDCMSSTILTIDEGQAFCVLQEINNYWLIKYNNTIGFIDNTYCFINLPDVCPSIYYDITNSYKSIYKTSYINIPELTGYQLYELDKTYNNKLGYDEFAVPILYSTAKLIAQAQYIANDNGYSLKIYDSYRPNKVTLYASNKLSNMYNSDESIRPNIDSWGSNWFLASGISTHNTGSAIDVTLVDLSTGEEVTMQTPMHELSSLSCKYESPFSKNYNSAMTEESILMDEIFTSVGLTGLASEWWHFQDNIRYQDMISHSYVCNFQITEVVSLPIYTAYYYISQMYNSSSSVNETYRIYTPENPETKPLMIFIPGMGGGVNESYNITGLYQYIQDGTVKPDCTIVFFYRDKYNGKIKSSYVKSVIDSLPHTDLYYCGFSLGAWDFHKYLNVGDFTKAILIDGYDTTFDTETSLEEIYVVQSYEHYVDEYNKVLTEMYNNNSNLKYEVIDLTNNPAHVECGWWLFAPTNEEYFKYKSVDFEYPVFNIMDII